MVGDGYAMGVAAEVLQHILGAAEGWFAVDDPVLAKQWPEPGGEDLGLSEQRQIAGQMKLVVLKSRSEAGDELAAKQAPEHRDREKESGTGSNPAGVIEREAARGGDAVDMRMKLELLVPGVKHAEEADLSPEMSGVASDFEKRFCTDAK
jgi:hypothetical protein